jgi:hypothetical protein
MELEVDLGPMPEDPQRGAVLKGLRCLLEAKEMCDVTLLVGGQSLSAHRVMLAAASSSFKAALLGTGSLAASHVESDAATGGTTIRLDDVTHIEAVQAMLDCIYSAAAVACGGQGATCQYSVSTDEVNRDVIWLAQQFQITPLLDQASQWILTNVTTGNVLRRLVLCEQFGLGDVRKKLLEKLIASPEALYAMAQDPETVKVPAVLQDLLVQILALLNVNESSKQQSPSQSPVATAVGATAAAAAAAAAVIDVASQKIITAKQAQSGKLKKAGA